MLSKYTGAFRNFAIALLWPICVITLAGCDLPRVTMVGGHLPSAWDTTLEAEEYRRLCREKSGTRIFEPIENVPGYFYQSDNGCSSCGKSLLAGRYEFVETEITPFTSLIGLKQAFVKSPGLYRYTLEDPNDPRCRPYFEWFEKHRWEIKKHPRYREKCVVATRIEKLKSKYRFHYERKVHSKYKNIKIRRKSVTDIFNWPDPNSSYLNKESIKTSHVFFSHNVFYYYPTGGQRKTFYGYDYYKCPPDDVPNKNAPSYLEILLPPAERLGM